jgi:hypothetical protein
VVSSLQVFWLTYYIISRSFWTGCLEQELQMVQLSATRCSCIVILWVSLVSFAAITLCVTSQWVFVVYFVIDSVQKLLDTPSYSHLLHVLHVLSVQSSWFNHPNNIWQNVHVMQLLILQWSPTSHHFLLLRSKKSTDNLQHRVWKTWWKYLRMRLSRLGYLHCQVDIPLV